MHHANIGSVYKNEGYIDYYHIKIDDYFKYTLDVNALEVESHYTKNLHEKLVWTCNENECQYEVIKLIDK